MRVAESGIAVEMPSLGCPLQWSRNLRVAESLYTGKVAGVWISLQWSRNLRVAESEAPTTPCGIAGCFNGAAT